MASQPVIRVENVSKQYRLGLVGTGTLQHDINRWWHLARGKPDPYLKVTENNDRASSGASDFVWALQDINFEVQKGEILGIIGRNGAGKSTLLKILSQVTGPTTGNVKVKGRIASLLEVGTGFHPELTGRENIFLNGAIHGMRKEEVQQKLDQIVEFSGCQRYVDTPVKRYSSGMTVRLGFAVAAHLEPEILIVDEVLAVGDADFRKKCVGKMKDVAGEGRTVLFVSHNMASIRNLCEKCIILKNGRIALMEETESAIEAYISQFAQTSEDDISQSQNRSGSGNIKFKSVEIFNNNIKSDTITTGSRSCFKIAFDCKTASRNVSFRLQIFSSSGDLLITCNNLHCQGAFESIEGPGTVDCIIPKIPLLPGSYYINLIAWIGTELSDDIEIAKRFEVEEGPFFETGLLPTVKSGMIVEHMWKQ